MQKKKSTSCTCLSDRFYQMVAHWNFWYLREEDHRNVDSVLGISLVSSFQYGLDCIGNRKVVWPQVWKEHRGACIFLSQNYMYHFENHLHFGSELCLFWSYYGVKGLYLVMKMAWWWSLYQDVECTWR